MSIGIIEEIEICFHELLLHELMNERFVVVDLNNITNNQFYHCFSAGPVCSSN